MTAVGFNDPADVISGKQGNGKGNSKDKDKSKVMSKERSKEEDVKGKNRVTITLSALSTNSNTTRLPPSVILSVTSKRREIEVEVAALEGAPSVWAAIREIRLFHSLVEVRTGVETALSVVRNVLQNPKDMKMYRVKISNGAFQRTLGKLKNSHLLMHAIGYLGGGDGAGASDAKDSAAYVLSSLSVRASEHTAEQPKDPGDVMSSLVISCRSRQHRIECRIVPSMFVPIIRHWIRSDQIQSDIGDYGIPCCDVLCDSMNKLNSLHTSTQDISL